MRMLRQVAFPNIDVKMKQSFYVNHIIPLTYNINQDMVQWVYKQGLKVSAKYGTWGEGWPSLINKLVVCM